MICPPSTNVILDYIQAKEGSTCLQGSLTNEIPTIYGSAQWKALSLQCHSVEDFSLKAETVNCNTPSLSPVH